jgi:hypothetical protein
MHSLTLLGWYHGICLTLVTLFAIMAIYRGVRLSLTAPVVYGQPASRRRRLQGLTVDGIMLVIWWGALSLAWRAFFDAR